MSEDIAKDAEEKTISLMSPHLALTHNELQHGAANGRNVSLLMKADHIPEALVPLVEKVLQKEIVIKATQRTRSDQINQALADKFPVYKYDVYVEDFDDSQVIFVAGGKKYHISYTESNDDVVLSDDLKEVSEVFSYEDDNGNPVYRRIGEWPNRAYQFVLKSLAAVEDKEQLASIFKQKEQTNMDELAKVQDLLKQEQDKAADLQATIDQLTEQVETFKASAEEIKKSYREEKLSAVVKDEESVTSLMKATAALDDEAFDVILKSYKDKDAALEESDLFKRNSVVSEEDKPADAGSTYRTQLIKAQFGNSQKGE